MKTFKTALLGLAFIATTAPAMAGGFSVDFPRITFPDSTPPVVTQSCANPATLTVDTCTTK